MNILQRHLLLKHRQACLSQNERLKQTKEELDNIAETGSRMGLYAARIALALIMATMVYFAAVLVMLM